MSQSFFDRTNSLSEQYRREGLRADNLTDFDRVVFFQLAGDTQLLHEVAQQDTPIHEISNAAISENNRRGLKLADALRSRLDQIELELSVEGLSESERAELQQKQALYQMLMDSPRYAQLQVTNCVDYEGSFAIEGTDSVCGSYAQMATFVLPDGTKVCSWAGTGPQVDSWLEDGLMQTTETGVLAQEISAQYVNALMQQYPEGGFILSGHSKGGNEALYAGICAEQQDRILGIYNYDGPGFGNSLLENPDFVRRYDALRERLGDGLYALSPSNSFVGQLMNDHDGYRYFQSSEGKFTDVFMAHDSRNWYFQEDGSLVFGQERTRLSIEMERVFEQLLTFSDAELNTAIGLVARICDANGIYELEDLGPWLQQLQQTLWEQCTDEEGRFHISQLPAAFQEGMQAVWNELSEEERLVLRKILGTLLTPENIRDLALAYLQDQISAGGLFSIVFPGPAVVVAMGIFAAASMAALGAEWARAVLAIRDWIGQTAKAFGKTVICGVEQTAKTIQRICGQVSAAIQEAKNRFSAFVRSLWDGFTRSGAFRTLKQWVDSFRDGCTGALNKLENWLRDTTSGMLRQFGCSVLEKSRAASVRPGGNWQDAASGAVLIGLERASDRLLTGGERYVSGYCVRYAPATTLKVDSQHLSDALTAIQKASDLADRVDSRLARLTRRLNSSGERDQNGIFHSYAALYRLDSRRCRVNHAAEIRQTAQNVRSVAQDYEDTCSRIRRAVPQEQ